MFSEIIWNFAPNLVIRCRLQKRPGGMLMMECIALIRDLFYVGYCTSEYLLPMLGNWRENMQFLYRIGDSKHFTLGLSPPFNQKQSKHFTFMYINILLLYR